MTEPSGYQASGRPLRVLLFSPLAGRDPASGDTTYTDVLLQHPPEGVTYTTYSKAMAAGSLRVRGRRARHGQLGSLDAGLLGVRGLEHCLRRKVMFREPLWFVTVDADAFDLVHSHLFALRQVASRVPTVSSAGFPLSVLYRSREKWSPRRAWVADRLERGMAKALGAHVPGYWASSPDVMTVYSEHYRTWLLKRGQAPDAVLVVGQGLPETPVVPRSDGLTVGFVGRDFERKGGDLAIEAFLRLRRDYPALGLIVATVAGAHVHRLRDIPGVDLHIDTDRQTVLDELLPRIDVLLAPTRADCGAPYGIQEALRAGCSVVLTPNPWLDERLLTSQAVTLATGSADIAAAAADRLTRSARDGVAARDTAIEEWRRLFGLEVFQQQLRAAYDAVLARHGAT